MAALLRFVRWLSQSLLLPLIGLTEGGSPTAEGPPSAADSAAARSPLLRAAPTAVAQAPRRIIVDDDSGEGSALASLVLRLPPGVRFEPARFLDMRTLAALATAERAAFQHLWEAPGLWQALSMCRGLPRPLPAAGGGAAELRDAFRRAAFRLDGARLRSCKKDHLSTLQEAAHMVGGLMPQDGPLMQELCSTVERALNSFDPACSHSVRAAEAFLDAALRSIDLIGEPAFERLEHAFRSAQNLHELMTSSMRAHLARSTQDFQESFWMENFDFPPLEEDSTVDLDCFWSDNAWDTGRTAGNEIKE